MSGSTGPTVLHVDLDAFFVSMELLRHPELLGKPVIVAGGLGPRSVVSTCSYEARAFGVRSAMPLATARRLCASAAVLTTDFSFYGPASRQFHEILHDFTPTVEPAGTDEAYLDLRGTERMWGPPPEVAETIRRRIRTEIGITGSVGIAANKLVAKVASDAAKPDGLLVVPIGGEAAFLAPRPIRDLPMVGPRTAERLRRMGVRTIGDLASVPGQALEATFGHHGWELRERALGIHHAPVATARGTSRSVSREHTFTEDEGDLDHLAALLLFQADRIAADLRRNGQAARTIVVKLRFPPFDTVTRTCSSPVPLSTTSAIYREARELFEHTWADRGRRPLRLLGTGVTNLQERAQQLSFGESTAADELDATVQALRERFGHSAVRRAAELESGGPARSTTVGSAGPPAG